ncbi:DMT family transporter [Haloarchaeobius sp. HME9146]|uniref:DUF7139 domain-containing protein n=1 Tax=Haloarchaeobius sp. HME9146 TaxID=2978732 RepID=UPI0021C103CC|nr:DMT family transporter [Haloarchaeobius sp. HME9146]MCT9095849.1 DMT family transporter [Haloarchaeobius sp. HME9146]
MTSLADVYEDNVGEVENLRRFYLGMGLFLAGALLTVLGIVVGATDVLAGLGVGIYGSREIAGVLGGLGIPAVLVGVFTVLPASRRIRAAAAIGASVCVLGVALFSRVYPGDWIGSPTASQGMTLLVAVVYFVGVFTAIGCLFSAVVTFKTRNDPGGTVTMQVTREGETKYVEVPEEKVDEVEGEKASAAQYGSVGMFGTQPDGNVETQTNRPGRKASASSGSGSWSNSSPTHPAVNSPTSDGGTTPDDIRSPLDEDAEVMRTEEPSPADKNLADRYCGNCAHFDYVRTNRGIQPYCAHHDEEMDDMEACQSWEPNN